MIARERFSLSQTPYDKVPNLLHDMFKSVLRELHPLVHPPSNTSLEAMMVRYKDHNVPSQKRTGNRAAGNYSEMLRQSLPGAGENVSIWRSQLNLSSQEVQFSRQTISNTAKELKIVSMKLNTVQKLDSRTFERRLDFAEEFFRRVDIEQIDSLNICFTGELFWPGS